MVLSLCFGHIFTLFKIKLFSYLLAKQCGKVNRRAEK